MKEKPKVPMRPLWSEEPCWECGHVCYATRSEPRPKSEPHYCGDCQVWRQAEAQFKAELDDLRSRNKALEAELAELKKKELP